MAQIQNYNLCEIHLSLRFFFLSPFELAHGQKGANILDSCRLKKNNNNKK